MTEAFSDLMRNGDSSKAETLLDDLLKRGAVHAKTLQAANDNSASSVFAYIPKEESQKIGSTFMKFMTGHVVESLDTSSKRGELAYLECLSASLELIRRGLDVKTGESPRHGAAAIHYFGQQLPDVMPVTLQALDEGLHKPLHQLADKVLADVGGMHYSHLENYYIMDVGRIYKARSEAGREPVVKSFNAHFRP